MKKIQYKISPSRFDVGRWSVFRKTGIPLPGLFSWKFCSSFPDREQSISYAQNLLAEELALRKQEKYPTIYIPALSEEQPK